MADFTSTSIPSPKDWQAFERKARLLFELSLGDPATQNNGRSGQAQHGVDIFGKRGGSGVHYVGVQCKGKDIDYGKSVTERELRDEVEKSKGFVPDIREFILITTAPDDAKIQESARLLEAEVRADGRDLSVAVWGWGRLQQEIGRFADAIREFHPDGSPFSGEILGATSDLKKLVQEQGDNQSFTAAANHQEMLQAIESLRPKLAIESSTSANDIEKHLNEEIDGYRELLREDKPRTAIKLLTKLKERVWSTASARVRFRIVSNLGAANHKIGEYDAAADFLMEAAVLDTQDPVGIANKIAAMLLKGQRDDAHALAMSSVAQHPDNVHIAVQRLLAVAPLETVEDVWHSLPASVRTAPEPYINRIVSLREAGDDRWYGAGNEALAVHPNDERLQTIHAEGVLERVLKGDPGAVGKAGPDVPTQAELEAASDILAKSWQRTLGPEITPQGAFAHNAALAKIIVGQPDAAALLLDAAEAHGYTSEETKFMRVSLYRKRRKIDEAIRIADTLPDSPKSQIVRADLRAERAPEEARRILADREHFTESRDIIAASLTVMEAYCEQRNFTDAMQEAKRLKARVPDDPQGALAIFRVKHQTGEAGAEEALDDALCLVTPETDFPTRFLVCDALTAAGRHNDVVDLLQSVTSTRFDSPALRMLLAAAVNSDRRATLAKLLKDIPAEILKLLYYRRVGIALAFSTGDIRSAERQLREFLAIEPKNLAIHLELLNALFRQNKQSDLKADSALSSSDFNGSPENFIRFAQFKKDFADWKEAHDLAYRVLLANQGNESVNIGYMAIFLFERRPTPIDLNPAIVAENMAIGVKREDGHISTYVIEPEPSLRPTTDYLAPNHAVARLLLGKSAGDSVELPDHTEARIVWVKPKELHALHVILENFNNVFPDAEGFEKVRVDASSPGALEPILERVRERHDVVSSIARKYDSGTLPLALMARLVGTDPVSAAVGIASSGHALRVCEGTQYERDMSFQVIAQNDRKGCVVDAVTLHFIRRFGLERVVEAVCGPIGVVERSVSRIQQKIHELEESLDKPSMSIFYRDGQYFREETTREQKSAALAVQQADRTWIAERAQLIPAEGGKDPSPAWGRQRFGSSFFDEARAASGSGRLFLSEDLPMRMLAQTEYGVGGCWLQPVLMKAVETRHMTNDEYLGAIVALIDANEEFISVSSSLLAYSLKAANSHALPSSFRKLAGRLGGAKADLTSHISVAFELIHRTWRDESLSPTLRQAIVGLLLENLVRDRNRSEVTAIMGTFDDFAASVEKSENLHRYLRDWLQGHFIILG